MSVNGRVRSRLEQVALPRSFYQGGASTILKMIGSQGDTILRMYRDIGRAVPGYVCPYSPKEFLESHMEYKERATHKSVLVIRVQMPDPEEPGQIRAAYFCYDKNSDQKLFCSSELEDSGSYRLAQISAGGRKDYFPNTFPPDADEFDSVAQYFLRQSHSIA